MNRAPGRVAERSFNLQILLYYRMDQGFAMPAIFDWMDFAWSRCA